MSPLVKTIGSVIICNADWIGTNAVLIIYTSDIEPLFLTKSDTVPPLVALTFSQYTLFIIETVVAVKTSVDAVVVKLDAMDLYVFGIF